MQWRARGRDRGRAAALLVAAILAAAAHIFATAAHAEFSPGDDYVVLIAQGKASPRPVLDQTIVELRRAPFELRLRAFPYNAAAGEFHAVRVAAADHLRIFDAAPGADLLESSFLGPGTGMAAGPGGYEHLLIDTGGHHYIFHDPKDPGSQRAPAVDRRSDGMLELRWRIRSLSIGGGVVAIEDSQVAAVAMVVVSDWDRDDYIHASEVARFVVVFRD